MISFHALNIYTIDELCSSDIFNGTYPDLIIFLDIPPEQGLARKRSLKDRFELEDSSFHQRIREGYVKMAAAEPDHWLVIDASLTKSKVAEIIWNRVSRLLA